MAHLLDQSKGRVAFFSVREIAWHGLGLILDNAPTAKDAIIHGGLDFEIIKEPLKVDVGKLLTLEEAKEKKSVSKIVDKFGDTTYRESKIMKDRFSTVRIDTNYPLGVVGSRYEVIQNTEMFDFFDAIVESGVATFETAGAINNGGTIFITAKINSTLMVNGKDMLQKYIVLSGSHDGTAGIKITFTTIRVVCNNTLSAAFQKSKNTITVRHTKNYTQKLQLAQSIMGIADENFERLGGSLEQFTKQKINDDQLVAFIANSLELDIDENGKFSTRAKNIVLDVLDYNFSNVGGQQMEHCKGTLYGAYNAISGYYNNVKSFKSKEERGVSLLEGNGKKHTDNAFAICDTLLKKNEADMNVILGTYNYNLN